MTAAPAAGPRSQSRAMSPPTVSACLVVFNEEALIGRCLESIRALCDEIIVVHDGPCGDATLEIARSFGARVFIEEHGGGAEAHRPSCFARATGDWILQMDADEFFGPDAVRELKRATQNAGPVNGFSLIWPMWDGGRCLSRRWPYKRCLFRRSAMHYIGYLHADVTVDGGFRRLDVRLEHQPHYNNYRLSESYAKHRKWARLHSSHLHRDLAEIPAYGADDGRKWPLQMALILKFGLLSVPLNALVFLLGVIRSGGWREPSAAWKSYRMSVVYYAMVAQEYAATNQEKRRENAR